MTRAGPGHFTNQGQHDPDVEADLDAADVELALLEIDDDEDLDEDLDELDDDEDLDELDDDEDLVEVGSVRCDECRAAIPLHPFVNALGWHERACAHGNW